MIVIQRGSTEGGKWSEVRYGEPADANRKSLIRESGTEAKLSLRVKPGVEGIASDHEARKERLVRSTRLT